MADRNDIFSWIGSEPGKAALAGALGGIVRWITLKPSWREGAGTLLVGAICAVYLGPIALPIIESTVGKIVPGGDMAGLSSFLVGIGGISLSGLVLDIFERRRRDLKGDNDDDGRT